MSFLPSEAQASPFTKTESKRLLIVDDHPVFRSGIIQFLTDFDAITPCGEAGDARSALEAMRGLHPDVVIMDVSMPGTNGIELIKLMLAEVPTLKILVLSMHDESVYALRSLRAGARGYVMKQQSIESIKAALSHVLAGGIYVSPKLADTLIFRAIMGSESETSLPVDRLSDRELEVLRLFGRSLGTRQIAETLHLSIKTIETHRAHIKEKLGFSNADEMVKFAVEWTGLSEEP